MTDDHAVPHYFDERGQPSTEWNSMWSKLEAVFGDSTPPHITLRRFSGDGGRFDGPSSSIVISDAVDGIRLVHVIAHESCHLSLYRATRGASATEPFRFIDEGMCDLIGKRIAGTDMAKHKQSSLAIAYRELQTRGLSFAAVQQWTAYTGGGVAHATDYAYQVGASFVYFVIDSFGERKLLDVLRDIGTTGDLDTSLRNILGTTAVEMERRWRDYVAR